MPSNNKKITSLSSFRAKKDQPTATESVKEYVDKVEHPMGPKDSPELVPGFKEMPKRAQQKVVEAFANANGFMEYSQDHFKEIVEVSATLRNQLENLDHESGILVAALLINACAGCQYLSIAGPEASIIFSSFYNQLVATVREKPTEKGKN